MRLMSELSLADLLDVYALNYFVLTASLIRKYPIQQSINHYAGDRYIKPDGKRPFHHFSVFFPLILQPVVNRTDGEKRNSNGEHDMTQQNGVLDIRPHWILFNGKQFASHHPVINEVTSQKYAGHRETAQHRLFV